MNAEGLRVAVIGCGYWGVKHVRVLSTAESVAQVVAIDADTRRLEPVCRTVPGAVCFDNVTDALPHFDAAVIATPPLTHFPLAMQLIAAGKHVMVEKPLATSANHATTMIAAAERAGVVLMVGHTFEYHAAVWKLREMLARNELGDLYYIDTARLNLGLYQSDVNVIDDLAPHDISIINYVLGAQPVAVQSWGARNAHRQMEDVAYIRLKYAEPDVVANVHVSWLDPCKVRRVTVVGSRKMAVYNDLASEERIRVYDKGVLSDASPADDMTPPMSYRYGDVVSPFLAVEEPLAVEDKHFVDCVRDGTRPMTDGANGLAVVKTLECAQISLREGRMVQLAELDEQPVAKLDRLPRTLDRLDVSRPLEASVPLSR
jgi:predicted dehydrogenase